MRRIWKACTCSEAQQRPSLVVGRRPSPLMPQQIAAFGCMYSNVQYGGRQEDEHVMAWWPRPKAERSERPVDHPISFPHRDEPRPLQGVLYAGIFVGSTAARFRSVTISCMGAFGSERGCHAYFRSAGCSHCGLSCIAPWQRFRSPDCLNCKETALLGLEYNTIYCTYM